LCVRTLIPAAVPECTKGDSICVESVDSGRGYCTFFFTVSFLLSEKHFAAQKRYPCFVQAKKKTDITSIKSNLNKVVNLQQAVTVTDSTFLLCRARAEILRERRDALYTSVRTSLLAKDETF
jgi:hypothetical protein